MSRRGTPRRKPRSVEDLVCHDEERCQAGVRVRLAWECEDVEKFPWLQCFHGQIGELVKPLGTGWGWLARFGDIEGTFRTRGVCMLAYADAGEPHDQRLPTESQRPDGDDRVGSGARVSIGGTEDGVKLEGLNARTPRGLSGDAPGSGRGTPRGIIKIGEEASHRRMLDGGGEEGAGCTGAATSSTHTDSKVVWLPPVVYAVVCNRSECTLRVSEAS